MHTAVPSRRRKESLCLKIFPVASGVCRLYYVHACYNSILNANFCRHMRLRHNENPRTRCEICNKVLGNAVRLKHHQIKKHGLSFPDVKIYACSMCKALCSTPSDLRAHETKHNGIRRFPCPHCEDRFKTKAYVFYHRPYSSWLYITSCAMC